MKTWIPPLVALALATAWISARHARISGIGRETAVLRERVELAAAPRAGEGSGPVSLAERRAQQAEEVAAGTGIDWKDLGESMLKAQSGGMPDMRAIMKMQKELMAMDADQLAGALDEIEALDADPQVRESLKSMVIGMLAEKEPKLVVERFFKSDLSPMDSSSYLLTHAFQNWATKDGAEARAWLDGKIAAGEFEARSLDGNNSARVRFEGALIASLLADDPAAAEARIEALPESQRSELFNSHHFMNLKPGHEKAFAELVRKHVPEGQRGAVLAQASTMMVHQGGLEKVGEYMREIEATTGEREAIALSVGQSKLQAMPFGGGPDESSIAEWRDWLAEVTPDSADTVAGKTLGQLWGMEMEKRVEMVEQMHAESGSDELLAGFIESGAAMQDQAEARRLAEMIQDEQRRAEVLEQIENGPVMAEEIISTMVVPTVEAVPMAEPNSEEGGE